MLCQNCGKNEANVKYTQIINGIKKEVMLCDQCARELGIGSFEFNMPIHLSDFLGDFFNDSTSDLLPEFVKEGHNTCNNCGENYNEFMKMGLLGCPECYDEFSARLDPILKKIQGNCRHIGRGINQINKNIKSDSKIDNQKAETKRTINKGEMQKEYKLNRLNDDLKKAIKEERYEDAAKLRDEIKKINEDK